MPSGLCHIGRGWLSSGFWLLAAWRLHGYEGSRAAHAAAACLHILKHMKHGAVLPPHQAVCAKISPPWGVGPGQCQLGVKICQASTLMPPRQDKTGDHTRAS